MSERDAAHDARGARGTPPARSAPPRWLLPAILAVAVALRLLAWRGAVLMINDGPDFLWQAERLLAGDLHALLSHPYHPLYGAASAALALLTGDVLNGALAVSILSALGIVLAVHALAARAWPARPWAAPAAALLAAVHTRTLVTTSDIQSDGLFLALALLACAALAGATPAATTVATTAPTTPPITGAAMAGTALPRRGRVIGRLLLAGLLTGLAYLARPEGLFVAAAAVLWSLSPRARGRGALGLLAFVAGLALVALPYVLALHRITGEWGLSLKPSIEAAGLSEASSGHALPPDCPLASPEVFRIRRSTLTAQRSDARPDAPSETTPLASPGATADAPPLEPTGEMANAAADAADGGGEDGDAEEGGEEDGDAPARQRERAGSFEALLHASGVLLDALRPELLVLALVGLLALAPAQRGLRTAALLLTGAWLGVTANHWALNNWLSARHMLFPALLLLPAAGAGLAVLWSAAGARARGATGATGATGTTSRGRRAAGFALRALLVLLVAGHAVSGARPRHSGSESRLEALQWAAAHTAPDDRLGVHRRKDTFYSGRPVLVVSLPCSEPELFEKLERHRVALLVLDLRRLQRHAPHWLADGPFREVARFGEGHDAVVVLERRG